MFRAHLLQGSFCLELYFAPFLLAAYPYNAYKNSCLVPRPYYSARPKRFGSHGPIENVIENVFPDRSPRIRNRNELTERDWENAVQGLGNKNSMSSLGT